MSLLAQYVLISLAVIASAVVVMRKQFPGTTRRARIAIALTMLREGSPGVLKKIGRRVAPKPAANAGKDCGGCDSCD